MTNIYGFSFLKDGVRFDYPFKEAFSSLSKIASKTYIALGQNDDGTREALDGFPKIEIIDTLWDMSLLGKGGVIFSQQTNIALEELRKNHKSEPGAWGIYLQSDEVLHENSIEQLKKDIETAETTGCDAISFRYFHFWKNHYEIAINKRWYPSEIRAVKLDSQVVNHGDAQGFSGFTKVYESDVYIHHYGHVRDEKKRQEKQKFLIKSIRATEKFQKYFKREKKAFKETKTLNLLINHPLVMKERIEKMGEKFTLSSRENIYILGDKSAYSKNILNRINSKYVHWVTSLNEVPKANRKEAVNLRPGLWARIFGGSNLPDSMESPLARKWDADTFLLLKLSQKGISLK